MDVPTSSQSKQEDIYAKRISFYHFIILLLFSFVSCLFFSTLLFFFSYSVSLSAPSHIITVPNVNG